MPRIIETLRDRGYTFVTVPELAAPCDATTADDDTAGDATGIGEAAPDQAALRLRRETVASR